MNAPIRVMLVDDHALCRRGLAELLEQHAGMKVVALTGVMEEAVAHAVGDKPDLIVCDLRMPDSDGLILLRRLREEGVTAPAVVLTVSNAEEDMATALRNGARGYLLKEMEPDDVIAALQRAVRGELVVAPAMTLKLAHMLQGGSQTKVREDLLASLTEREREILDHLVRGETNKAIARALNISHDTVKLHVRHILSKLNLTSRVEAAVFAVEHRSSPGQMAKK